MRRLSTTQLLAGGWLLLVLAAAVVGALVAGLTAPEDQGYQEVLVDSE